MVYRPPYPWYIDPPNPLYFDPPAHGISTPLPMVYQTLSYGIMNSSLLVEMRGGGVNLPGGGSKYNDKKLTPGVQIPYGKLNPGSKYMKIDPGVNLPWDSKYHMTPGIITRPPYQPETRRI